MIPNQLTYVLNILSFAFKRNPTLSIGVFLAILSVLLELLAMSCLLPLFASISQSQAQSSDTVVRTLSYYNIVATTKNLFICFLFIYSLRVITQIISQSLNQFLGRKVMAQLTFATYENIIKNISFSDISKNSIGHYLSLAGDESFKASNLVISICQFGATLILGILYFIVIINYSLNAGIYVSSFFIVCSLVILWVLKTSHRLGKVQTEESRKTNTLFMNGFNNLKAVRSLTAEDYVCNNFKQTIFHYGKIIFLSETLTSLTKLLPILILLIITTVWVYLFSENLAAVNFAFLITLVVYLLRLFPVAGQAVTILMRIASDAKSGKDISNLIELKRNFEDIKKIEQISKIQSITFDNVTFSYSKKTKLINNLSFKLEQSKSYAIVGKSGLGKSTIFDLLLKFRNLDNGSIKINSTDISLIDESVIRKKIILVCQETTIFDDTIENNIKLGIVNPKQSLADVINVACLDELISNSEQGVSSRVQYQGKNLSGGQRQRISIARAIIRNPEVIIFDESTSALDKATQTKILNNLLQDKNGRILIFITHDPEVMHLVDEIIDIEKLNYN